MSIDPAWLFLSLIPAGIGFVLFVYGKKHDRWPLLVAGLVFMAYPYFTPTLASLIGVGVALGLGLWLLGGIACRLTLSFRVPARTPGPESPDCS
jgi:hypothetical protein